MLRGSMIMELSIGFHSREIRTAVADVKTAAPAVRDGVTGLAVHPPTCDVKIQTI